MKRRNIFILMFFLYSNLYSISISDFTVIYDKDGKMYNFYDNPSLLFCILKKDDTLNNIGTGYSEEYNFEACTFSVLSREFKKGVISPGILYEAEKEYNVKNPNCYYAIDYFEAYKDFSTIRGISIGDDIKKVLDKYPEAVLYKNNGRYKWKISDCYWETKIKNPKKTSDIGYVLIESANWQYNRSFEVGLTMHYELVFVMKDSKVKSIVMQYVVDGM